MEITNANQPNSTDEGTDLGRREFLKATAGIAAGAAGASSTLHAPFVRGQSSNVTLRFLNNETSASCQKVLRDAADEYEGKFGVKIVVDTAPLATSFPKILTAIKAGVPYHLATQANISYVLQLVGGGYLVPLTDLVNKYSWGNLGAWQYKGEHWFYPYDYNLVTIYYRKDWYAEKGLRIPTTWHEFAENCRALTVARNGEIERGGCVIPIMKAAVTNWASFGSLFAEVPKFYDDRWEVVLDKGANLDRTAQFLDFFGELYKTMPPGMNTASYAEMMGLFVTEKAAHSVYSGRLVETIESRNPSLADKFGIFPSPDIAGKRSALSFAFDGFSVFKTNYTQEARKFLEWFIDNHYIDWLHSAWMNFQPARMDIYEDPRWRGHPMIKKYWATMAQLKTYIEPSSSVLLDSVELSGPAMDMRPCEVHAANVMPQMLENKILRGMPSRDCVTTAASAMRKIG
jgi:multiple sugar transport system substrate-binding protein